MKITAYIKHTAVAALVVTIFAACSTDENFYYQDTPRVRLVGPETWAVGTDSILFSFVTYPQETKEMVFDVKAQIMGQPSQQARTATIAIDNSKTTASESMYSVPATVTIAAGETSATFPVTVKRDASLTTKQVRLYIKVTESSDFKVGVNEENHLSIIWSDVLSRPLFSRRGRHRTTFRHTLRSGQEDPYQSRPGQYSDGDYPYHPGQSTLCRRVLQRPFP